MFTKSKKGSIEGVKRVAGIAAVAAALLAAPGAGDALAQYVAPVHFYAVADQPAAASYVPSNYGTGGLEFVDATVTRSSAGAYRVRFAGGGTNQSGGNVQVTALGTGGDYCKVSSWGGSASGLDINVRCFKPTGMPVNAKFIATFVKGGQRRAYAWVNNPAASSSTPPSSYSYNAVGGGSQVTRNAVGSHTVTFPLYGTNGGGNVQVTAYGTSNGFCKVASWGGGAMSVRCFDNAGNAADVPFSILYEDSPIGFAGTFAWADQALAASYTPSAAYQANFYGSTGVMTRLGTGRYRLTFPTNIDQGAPMVTAYGSGSERCKIEAMFESGSYPNYALNIEVRCHSRTGAAVDTRFSVRQQAY